MPPSPPCERGHTPGPRLAGGFANALSCRFALTKVEPPRGSVDLLSEVLSHPGFILSSLAIIGGTLLIFKLSRRGLNGQR